MPQLEFYSVPAKAKEMSFGELFCDCCHQARGRNIPYLQPVISTEKGALASVLLKPAPTSNIPTPQCLGDAVKLFMASYALPNQNIGPTSIDTSGLRSIIATRLTDGINRAEVLSLIQSSKTFSHSHWMFTNPLFNMTEEARVTKVFELGVDGPSPMEFLVKMIWLDEERDGQELNYIRESIERAPRNYIKDLLLLTATISCGLSSNMIEWVRQNLVPFLVSFREKQLLTLVYQSVADQYDVGNCELFTIEVDTATFMVTRDLEEPDLYTRCLFPLDSHALSSPHYVRAGGEVVSRHEIMAGRAVPPASKVRDIQEELQAMGVSEEQFLDLAKALFTFVQQTK